MGIRANNNTKNQFKNESNHNLSLVGSSSPGTEPSGHLRFYTSHPLKPCLVDLTPFLEGREQPNSHRRWLGPFTGRPELINELIPAIQDRVTPLIDESVANYIGTLRAWWRLFDRLENSAPELQRLTSTAQLTELHRQSAISQNMDRLDFGRFLALANTTRISLGLKRLYWETPERKNVERQLAMQWQCDTVRHALKHTWFSILDRWTLADALLESGAPLAQEELDPSSYHEQKRLLKNYQRLANAITTGGQARPPTEALYAGVLQRLWNAEGYSIDDMLNGRYPNGSDIRAAFHLCLATTGWNPAVLLSLDVNNLVIEPHPKDKRRYVLRGTKVRAGGAEQVSEGLFKSQGSAGVIIQTLVQRTARLREQLSQELEFAKIQLRESVAPLNSTEANDLRERITFLEQGQRSVWLYTPQRNSAITFLSDKTFGSMFDGEKRQSYLGKIINTLNKRQPSDRKLSFIKAGDLRDAYANRVYRSSGGSILSVMKALGHRRADTTQGYLDNTLLKEEHRKLFGTFSKVLWSEIELNGRVDPTILAKWSRDGDMTRPQQNRLENYRTLMISRIGTGCKDPLNPPRHIDPNFVADGQRQCHVQRCTLCVENAVILPESLPGLSKRLAELRQLRVRMGVGLFEASTFFEETENTEIALQAFDPSSVEKAIQEWTTRIENGEHFLVEFDGSASETNK